MKPDQGSSEPPKWERSTVLTSCQSSKSSRTRDIRNSLNRHGIRYSTLSLKRLKSTRRYGLINPTWHSTVVSDLTVTVLNFGKHQKPDLAFKEVVHLWKYKRTPGACMLPVIKRSLI